MEFDVFVPGCFFLDGSPPRSSSFSQNLRPRAGYVAEDPNWNSNKRLFDILTQQYIYTVHIHIYIYICIDCSYQIETGNIFFPCCSLVRVKAVLTTIVNWHIFLKPLVSLIESEIFLMKNSNSVVMS